MMAIMAGCNASVAELLEPEPSEPGNDPIELKMPPNSDSTRIMIAGVWLSLNNLLMPSNDDLNGFEINLNFDEGCSDVVIII